MSATRRSDDGDADGPQIGWFRALLSGLAILLVTFGAAVVGANEILTKLTGLSRSGRQWLATVVFTVVILGVAFLLRRLQSRRLI